MIWFHYDCPHTLEEERRNRDTVKSLIQDAPNPKTHAITNSRLSNALNEFWDDVSNNMQILNMILTTDIKNTVPPNIHSIHIEF